jgi:hypothetical protein
MGTEFLTYQSQSGTCGTTPAVTETWNKNLGYTYCSSECQWQATVYAQIASGDWEYGDKLNLYNIIWDQDQNWCTCKGGNWTSNTSQVGQGAAGPQCCGDDGASDDFCDGGYKACLDGLNYTNGDSNSFTCACGKGNWTAKGGEQNCCGDDGASDDFCISGFRACLDGYNYTNGDSNSYSCGCGGGSWIGSGGEQNCCGDDTSETWIYTNGACVSGVKRDCGVTDSVCPMDYGATCLIDDLDCSSSFAITCNAGGPYSPGSTVITLGSVVNQVANAPNVTNLTIKIYKNGNSLQTTNYTMPATQGRFSTTIASLGLGSYTANVSSRNGTCNASFIVSAIEECQNKTIILRGRAFNARTGQNIALGNATIVVKETGDSKEVAILDGQWYASFPTCLESGKKYVLAIEIRSSDMKSSWSEIDFLSP